MMEIQLKLFNADQKITIPKSTGKLLRDVGINNSVMHADLVNKNWSDDAYNFLLQYINSNKEFMAEELRASSKGIVPDPPSLRAWGSVIVRAVKSGLITRTEYRNVSNPKAHCTPASVWTKFNKINQ
jgi:hypothetical protein